MGRLLLLVFIFVHFIMMATSPIVTDFVITLTVYNDCSGKSKETSNNENNYEVNINKSNPLDKNYLSKKTMVIIAMLNYKYWCPNKKVKDMLYKTYSANNEKYQKEIEEKYSVDNLFKNKQNAIQIKQNEESVAMIEYKESIFRRIINKIKGIFHR